MIRESVDEPGQLVPVSPDIATCDDCMRDFRSPDEPPLRLSFHQLHQLRTALHDHPHDPLRPAADHHGVLPDVRALPARVRRSGGPPLSCAAQRLPGLRAIAARCPRISTKNATVSLRFAKCSGCCGTGRIVAIKGLGGFHLVCDPSNDAAVRLLRERKKRSDKPFALMVPDIAAAERLCFVSERGTRGADERSPPDRDSAATSGCAGFAGARSRQQHAGRDAAVHAAPSSAVRRARFQALVMTSGNLSEEPIVTGNREAAARLGRVADAFLFHNRDIHTRVDDSVVRVFRGQGARAAPFARLCTVSGRA